MFTDISISSDLNSSFNDFLSKANASLGVGFSLFVLQVSVYFCFPVQYRMNAWTLNEVNNKLTIYYPVRRNINGWHRHTSKPPTPLPYPGYQRISSAPTDRCSEGWRHERRLDRNRKLRVKNLRYPGYYTISTASKLALCLGAKIVKSAMTKGGKNMAWPFLLFALKKVRVPYLRL